MKVSKLEDTPTTEGHGGAVMREVITAKDGAPNFAMRIIEVKPGSTTPSHSHDWEHEVFILSGRGIVKGEKGDKEIAKDSVVYIPPNEHHCLVSTGDEPLRFV
jgi:quercetin dioxygenase-like cupin family protein